MDLVTSNLKIIFFGTPEFAVPSLEILVKNNYNIVGIVTAPDKPAGRGLQLHPSPVKKFAEQHQLKILQPEKLKANLFLQELKSLDADLQGIVAFRMLPDAVWSMPPLGTFNLHASLLPHYRGAAPINWAIINGEKETGVTTFFLQHEIDTGKIIFQEKISIGENETAGELHDRMKMIGAGLVLKTVKAVERKNYPQLDQPIVSDLKKAPKIFTDDCRIDWNKDVVSIYNQIRGLSPYPTAFTTLYGKTLKIFAAKKILETHPMRPGEISTDGKSYLRFAARDGFVEATDLQAEGKKRMKAEEFLKGFRL